MNSNLITFGNTLSLDGDGWAQLAPFGDFPGQALIQHPDGRIEKLPAIQRLDRAAAEGMARRFQSPWGKLKRYFTGCPIYAGHPDVPALANEHRDRAAKGMITELQVRVDGLYARPVFTPEGSALVEGKTLTAFSGYWTAVEIGVENGQKIFRPDELKSAGLTNRPNLPVKALVNEASISVSRAESPEYDSPGQSESASVALGSDQEKPVSPVGAKLTTCENESPAPFQTESPAEPTITILNAAIEDGRITLAMRAEWAQRLDTDFANESATLQTLPPCVKTAARARTRNLGLRKAEFAGERHERIGTIHELVRHRIADTGEDYPTAFARIEQLHPALFDAMSNQS